MVRRNRWVVLMAITVLAGAAAPQRRVDERELLQAMARSHDRSQLRPDVLFAGPSGVIQQGVRCATRTVGSLERELVDRLAEAELAAADRPPQSKIRVPVVFHVVRTRKGRWDVPAGQIEAQMKALDAAFRDRGLEFVLQEVRRYDENRFARNCSSFKVERRFKHRNAVDPATTLNVYTCRPAGGLLGYAWFPTDWPEDSSMHGVVVRYSTFPGGSATPYDEGDTVVHEVGHWAGLYHTFQGGCIGAGDRVEDTPAESTPTYGCPAARDSCPSKAGADPFDNFMDYSDDVCMVGFSPGQHTRMLDQLRAFRPRLVEPTADSD